MPDRSPDPDEVGDAAPSSGGRRSGLDRLRAARGGAAAAPAEERTAGTDRPAGGDAATGGTERSASTAVLESDADVAEREDLGTDATTDRDADSGAGSSSKRRRGRRAGAATAAGGATAAADSRKRTATRPLDPAARPASRTQVIAAAVLTLLVIGLLVPVIWMRHRVVGQSHDEKTITSLVNKQTDAAGFARRFAVTFFSPDYKTIDNYSNQVSAETTGDFKKDFDGKRGQLKSLLTQVQSQASGRVLAAGVSKVSGNVVEVLVVADQDVKNTSTKGKTVTNRYRVKVTLQKTDKGWLVQGLEPVI